MIAGKLERFLAEHDLQLRLLDDDHVIDWFDCGLDLQMNDWLARTARRWQDENLCKAWILSNRDDPNSPLGFFTLSAHQIAPESVPKTSRAQARSNKAWVHNLTVPFPATLLGKFALDSAVQGKNFGNVLMACVYVKHLEAASLSGSKFLVLDVQHDTLASYYRERFGFLHATGGNGLGRMIKSTKTIEAELEQAL